MCSDKERPSIRSNKPKDQFTLSGTGLLGPTLEPSLGRMLNGAPGGWAIGHEGQLQDMCHFSVSPPPTGAAIWARSNVWCSEVWMYTQLLSLATGTCNFTSWNIVQCYNQFSPCKTVGIAL